MDKQKIINKMVSNARAIISNQIALPLGCLKMNRIIVWLNSSQCDIDIDVSVFSKYNLKTKNLPVGTERLYWNIEKLIEFEQELAEIDSLYKADILRICRRLIDRYGT